MKTKFVTAVIVSVAFLQCHICRAQDDAPQNPTYLLNAVDSETKKHIAGLKVSMSVGDATIPVVELDEPYLGIFNYATRLKPGKYKITIKKPGFDPITDDVTIGILGQAETKKLRFTRTKGQPPAGPKPGVPGAPAATMYQLQVKDKTTNRKLDGAKVTISGQGRNVTATEKTTHYAAPLGPGRYSITASKPGYTEKSVVINLGRDSAKWFSVVIALDRAKGVPKPNNQKVDYNLSAVDGQTRRLMSGLTVTISSGNVSTKAQELGEPFRGKYNYYAAGLKPGKYKVTYSKSGFDAVTANVTIPDTDEGFYETKVLRLTRTKAQPPAPKILNLWINVLDDEKGTSILNPTVRVSTGDARLVVKQTKGWHYAQMRSGRYNVFVSKTGYVAQEVAVTMGAKKDEIRKIRLKRVQPSVPKRRAFQLRVIDDLDSKPLSGVLVSIKRSGIGGTTVKATEQRGARIVNNYTAELAPGKYRVTISKAGYIPQSLDANVIREGIRQVIKPIRLKRVQKPPTLVTLWFKVVDDESGKSLSGAAVAVSTGGVAQKVSTAKDLYFSQLKPGAYTATVTKAGYSSERVEGKLGLETKVQIVRLKRTKVPTPLPLAFSLQLEVVDEQGASIRNPVVVITSGGLKIRPVLKITPVQKNGFNTTKLKQGRYSVNVSQRGYAPRKIDILIAKSDIKRRITLKRSSNPTPTPPKRKLSLTIVVVDSKNNAVDSAKVSVTNPEIPAKFQETAGSYKTSGLTSGLYTVTVSKTGYNTEEVKVLIGLLDGVRKVILKRAPQSEFVLRVIARDEIGEPIISFESKADSGIVVKLEQQIAYTARLKPGSYEVRVEKTGYETQIHPVTIRDSDKQLDLQLKLIKNVTDPINPKSKPSKGQPGGLALKRGKSTQSTVSPSSPGGLLLKAGKSSSGTVSRGQPGGLGLTAPKNGTKTKPKAPDRPVVTATLTISRKSQPAR